MTEDKRLDRWNWGAMFLSPLWSLWYGVWQGLFIIVPFVNFILPFYLGFKGTRLAWEKKKNKINIDDFLKSQKRWQFAGIITFCVSVLMVVALFAYLFSLFNNSGESFLTIANSNADLVEHLGYPVEKTAGFSSFSQKIDLESSEIKMDVYGTQKAGKLTIRQKKFKESWVVVELSLLDSLSGKDMVLIDSPDISYFCDNSDQIPEAKTFKESLILSFEKMVRTGEGFLTFDRNPTTKGSSSILQTTIEEDKNGELYFLLEYVISLKGSVNGNSTKCFAANFKISQIDELAQIFLDFFAGSDLHRANYSWSEEIGRDKNPENSNQFIPIFSPESKPRPFY